MRYIKYFLLGLGILFFMSGCIGPDRSDALIVIDAGHGGHDCGALCNGKQEKELVLQITQRLAKEFKRKGYKIYLTRGKDKFLKLGERTRIADKMDAKVFITIHANAIADKKRFETIEGIETYYLQKTRDARTQRVAARENAAVLQGADALSKDVIIDSVLNGPKIVESNKLALDVQRGMMKQIKSRYHDAKDGGAKPAPFYVLVGASRPSILVEVGYITNSKERERLFSTDYQKRIAKGIVEGVSRYLDNRKADIGV